MSRANKIDLYLTSGWDIKEETESHWELTRTNTTIGGHVLVFFLTFWFTFGIGNIVYWLVNKEKKRIMKTEGDK